MMMMITSSSTGNSGIIALILSDGSSAMDASKSPEMKCQTP